MLASVPVYVTVMFILTFLLTAWLFLRSVQQHRKLTLLLLSLWTVITGALAWSGYFLETTTLPPRILVAVLPPLLTALLLIITNRGMRYTQHINLRNLTLLHMVRIPVELVLYWLSVHKAVPELMTFSGRNFDILSGITAPLMVVLCFSGNHVARKKLLLAWNIICLLLLLNIVINAILSAPFIFQQFAFDQPNIAVLHFPFSWLPACIVPIVFYAHIAAIRRLTKPAQHKAGHAGVHV